MARRARGDQGRRAAAGLRQHHPRAGASGQSLDRVERVFFHLVGTASSDEIEAIQREIQPRLAREDARDAARRRAVRPRRRRSCERAPGSTRRRGGSSSAAGWRSSAPAPGSAPRESSGWPRSPSGSPRSARAFRKTCSATKRRSRWCSSRRPISRGCPSLAVAAAAAAAEERGHPGNLGGHAVTLLGRAVPAIFGAARPARKGLARLRHRAAPASATTRR